MKRTLLSLILVLLALPAIFSGDVLSTDSKDITAYKRLFVLVAPDPDYSIRVLGSAENELNLNEDSEIPESSRQASFKTFSWVASGNIWGQITVTLTFAPMYWSGDSSSTMIIPYDVILRHTSSRIGNTTIAVNRAPGSAATLFSNEYSSESFYYADDVSFEYNGAAVSTRTLTTENNAIEMVDAIQISTSPKSITAKYNLSSRSSVVDTNGNPTTNTYSVCDYWNRRGSAYIYLRITSDGRSETNNTLFDNGMYYANVTVQITAQ